VTDIVMLALREGLVSDSTSNQTLPCANSV
jgi:hypothetical protein